MLENQVKIPIVAAIFHNLIRLLHGDEEWLEHQPHNIHLANFVDLPDGDENNDSARVGKGSPKLRMIASGSPKLRRFLPTTSATNKKSSPKYGGVKKSGGSPKVKKGQIGIQTLRSLL